jgi:uncharacterized protein YbbK (DUF523 family)
MSAPLAFSPLVGEMAAAREGLFDAEGRKALKILISACLHGLPVRYDGRAKMLDHPRVARWREEGRLVAICPELAGGFTTPRLPAEIEEGMNGEDVLAGRARVLDSAGMDVTAAYIDGAKTALDLARQTGCVAALLIDGSPSCGSRAIYDGSFSGRKHEGEGVTAALFRAGGLPVFAQDQLETLAAFLGEG